MSPPIFPQGKDIQFLTTLPPPADPVPADVKTPKLFRLKPEFPAWIWAACHAALDTSFGPDLREQAMVAAQPKFLTYPARPTAPLPPSRSVTALRAILDLAPPRAEPPSSSNSSSTQVHRQHEYLGRRWSFGQRSVYYWTDAYCDKVYTALMDIINEHGLGEQGWMGARWEVYDRVSPFLSFCFGCFYL